ncbi:MAG: hypothetical protein GY794_13495 [bacterium]|nr:hypothetical protein [bacterium]
MNNGRHPYRARWLVLALLIFAVLQAVAPSVRACQTPVFRYALERWPGDYYPLLIYHDKPLTTDQQAIVNWLGEVQAADNSQVSLYLLDVSKPATTQPTTQPQQSHGDAQRAFLLKKFPPPADVSIPVMVLRYPVRHGEKGALWPVVYTGPLDVKVAREMIDSPARQEIAKRLLSGDSGVWVMLESGDKAKDDAAAKLLTAELARMNKELELPEQTPVPDDGSYGREKVEIELKVAFSVLRVSPKATAERMFVKMLLGSEEGLDKVKGPIVFPIFGRGRALAAFYGKWLDAENIEDACVFLVGRCSCEVKSGNPGTDIMFSMDWDAALTGQPMMSIPPLPRLAITEVDAVDVASEPNVNQGIRQSPATDAPDSMLRIVVISLAVLLVVAIFPMVWVIRKRGAS